jgi:hypothetical protein
MGMSPLPILRGVLLLAMAAAVVPIGSRHAHLEVAAHGPASVTVDHAGVRVDVPPSWERVDVRTCELRFPRWAPPGPDRCSPAVGVVFYGSATFDPAYGPGVRRVSGAWAGYAYAGEFAVYVSGGDRDQVRKVLDSVR